MELLKFENKWKKKRNKVNITFEKKSTVSCESRHKVALTQAHKDGVLP